MNDIGDSSLSNNCFPVVKNLIDDWLTAILYVICVVFLLPFFALFVKPPILLGVHSFFFYLEAPRTEQHNRRLLGSLVSRK